MLTCVSFLTVVRQPCLQEFEDLYYFLVQMWHALGLATVWCYESDELFHASQVRVDSASCTLLLGKQGMRPLFPNYVCAIWVQVLEEQPYLGSMVYPLGLFHVASIWTWISRWSKNNSLLIEPTCYKTSFNFGIIYNSAGDSFKISTLHTLYSASAWSSKYLFTQSAVDRSTNQ